MLYLNVEEQEMLDPAIWKSIYVCVWNIVYNCV